MGGIISLFNTGVNLANQILVAKNAALKIKLDNEFSAAKNPIAMRHIDLSIDERRKQFPTGVYSERYINEALNNGYIPPGYNMVILRHIGFEDQLNAMLNRAKETNQKLMDASKELIKKLLKQTNLLDPNTPNLEVLIKEGKRVLGINKFDLYADAFDTLIKNIEIATGESAELDRLKGVQATANQQINLALATKAARLNSIVGSWLSGKPGAYLPGS